ncbi:MAG: PQQ-binding-like beta-propeller repeat protein, partial [Promethearchaeia archaeon]
MSTNTAKKKWEFETGEAVVSSVLFSQDDSTLFVGSRDKKIYALSVETGTKLWEFQADSYVESPPVLSPNGAFLAVAPMDNTVYSLVADREAIGAIAWTFETDMMMISYASVTPDSSTVFVGS